MQGFLCLPYFPYILCSLNIGLFFFYYVCMQLLQASFNFYIYKWLLVYTTNIPEFMKITPLKYTVSVTKSMLVVSGGEMGGMLVLRRSPAQAFHYPARATSRVIASSFRASHLRANVFPSSCRGLNARAVRVKFKFRGILA